MQPPHARAEAAPWLNWLELNGPLPSGRFRLPSSLPPTFKGSAVRFSYSINVRAVYQLRQGEEACVRGVCVCGCCTGVWLSDLSSCHLARVHPGACSLRLS